MHPPALPGSQSGYRPAIDGLRALAIAPVVLHHAAPSLLPGGFIGVDVFFVISGYLIGGIIAGELAADRFSLWGFWERRLRRIVPALAAMLAASTLAAWALLTPEDFRQFAKALVAASVFASNLQFARGSDYFDSAEGTQPLLHTWTLGVEEQFYLLFPLLLLAVWRWRPQMLLPVVALLGLASFALAIWLAPRWPLGAFYLLPTRMWELALGAACALLPRAPRAHGALALAGIGLILAGFWLIGPATPAPGAMFLLPTLGTALVLLFAGEQTAAARALGQRPLVWLGLVSFGIYLWHQPVLFFLQYVHFGALPWWMVLAGMTVSLVLGAMSFALIEQPVRQRQWLAHPALLLAVCAFGLAFPLVAGAAAYAGPFSSRSMAEAARLDGLRPAGTEAEIVVPDQSLAFVLFGDSHAGQYYSAAKARFGAGALVSSFGCLSAGGLASRPPGHPKEAACRALPSTLENVVAQRKVRTVIWAQRWGRWLYRAGDSEPLGTTYGAGKPHLLRAMERFAARLPDDVEIILVGNAPTAQSAGGTLERGWLRCRAYANVTCPDSFPESRAEGRAINSALAAFAARHPRFTYVDAAAPLCPDGRCLLVQEGRLNFWDESHLSHAAATRVMAQIDPALIR
jgi:peptidoglycan/LPS O-acetylase OafA/YrhL